MSGAITCEVCDGSGEIEIVVPVCCGYPTRTGECCCNPVPQQDVEPCGHCGGVGYYFERAMTPHPEQSKETT